MRQTGMAHEILEVDCPPCAHYLLEYFGRASMRRQHMDQMPLPITSAELASWASLNGLSLSAFEVEALDALESAYLRFHSSRRLAAK